jgi:hypothetical protein
MTWAPGYPQIIEGRLLMDGGWIEKENASAFNLYRPPPPLPPGADPAKAGPWLNHVKKIYPDDFSHILDYFAHRVQHPEQKINHGLSLGGGQGIGKDTMLEPLRRAVGPWNFQEISPLEVMGRFNGYRKALVL